jgi:ferredoxin-2, mitochondrial
MLVNIKFRLGGETVNVQAKEGETILDIRRRVEIARYLECACEGALACATCHVVVDPAFYLKTIEVDPISDDEKDLLDLAEGLSETSRLSCQIKIKRSMEGMTLIIPRKWKE